LLVAFELSTIFKFNLYILDLGLVKYLFPELEIAPGFVNGILFGKFDEKFLLIIYLYILN
jgi:hypothetical protein